MAENILREPENPRYHTFKHENDTIKRRLIQPKGALEYALALGFRPKVMNLQSYYMFNPNKMVDLRTGAAMLREAIDRETEKEEQLQRNRQQQKVAAAAVAQNIKLAILDDRMRKMVRDERERELREARGSVQGSEGASAARASSPSSDQSSNPMPGLGHTLTSVSYNPGVDQPPPYYD
ncbi:hypothetical protein J3R82DRAFT_4554 [Butyriboletus roseoflavus]|nr:hypothetical protein J3R82DRAFT_4554 [Butyriboletus roseoflavus]